MTFKTHYSFRKATGSPDEVCARLKELCYQFAPISDIDSTFGFMKWQNACDKYDLKPIFGVQIGVTESINAKKPAVSMFTFYAVKNVKSVNDIVTLAYKQGRSLPRLGFTPLIRYDQLATFEDVIIVSDYKAQLDKFEPAENIFACLSPACSKGFIRRAIDKGFRLFPMQEQRFVMEGDSQFYELAAGTFNADLKTYPQWILDNIELDSFFDIGDDIARGAWDNENLFRYCTARIGNGELLHPEVDKTLLQMCEEGAVKKGIDLSDPVYKERLATELKVIADKELDDYFFIVADVVQWAKSQMVVGPGRGSAAGSLVCYLLDITDIDPVKYGLLFFRFLSVGRNDAADIDTDYADRDVVIDYLCKKYGKDRVARIGTIGSFQAANTTNDVTKQLRLPRYEFDELLNSIDSMTANDARRDKALETALHETPAGKKILGKYPEFEIAGRMGGTPSNASTHASGVLVSQHPLNNYFAINPIQQSVFCEQSDSDQVGLLKLDILGLENLNIIDRTLQMAGKSRDWLYRIDREDKKAFDVINDNKFMGLFQYEGAAVKKLTQQTKVTEFNDLIVLSSLARPGPLMAGSAERWVKKKNGEIPVSYPHELLKPYLEETLGEMAYQETVMNVAHYVAGLDWGIVSKLRKAIAKSMGAEAMKEYGEPFINGMLSKGIPQDVAEKFWQDILGCGAYLFNKSHAAAYGLISYWTCYLKAHFPLEFAAASLTSAKTVEKQIDILREMQQEGIDYVPFDIETSTDRWRVVTKGDNKILVGPLSNVIGVGPKKMNEILACRARGEPLPDSLTKLLQKAKSTFSSLTPIADWIVDNGIDKKIVGTFTKIEDVKPTDEWQEGVYICGVCEVIAERDENDDKRVKDRMARGQKGKMEGETKFVEIRVKDDTETIYAKIGRYDFDKWGKEILEKGREKKTMVMIRGTVPPEIPMILIKNFRIVGEI